MNTLEKPLHVSKSAARSLAAQFANNRFIYTEEGWTTDSFTAIKAHIEPNSPKVQIEQRKPSMAGIFRNIGSLKLIKSVAHLGEQGQVMLINEDMTVRVNAKYYETIQKAVNGYAWPRITGPMSPVCWVDDSNEIVALLMPMREL